MVIKEYIENWRKKVEIEHTKRYTKDGTIRQAILESLFHPKMRVENGKGNMTHLHPETGKLHMPHGVYISDWKKYQVEDHPALMEFQKRCHTMGLHDPWLRNFAHSFYTDSVVTRSCMRIVTTRLGLGFLLGFVLWLPKYLYVDYFKLYKYEHTPAYIEKYGHEEVFH